jgi:enoyl-CoA hydratase/carnithine racemase
MYEQIRYEVAEPIATLSFNRPERLNAWTPRMGDEIRHALASAESDPRVVVVIVTGEGRGFCSGADLRALDALSQGQSLGENGAPLAADPGDPSMRSYRGTFSYPMSIPKPIIGAINGPCVGLGLVIALFCDIRFASDRATFSTAFARRGLIAEWGIGWMLPRLIGLGHALDLLLSARTLDAAEAVRIGLANRVVPHDELLRVARDYALDIAENCAPGSLAVIKREVLEHLSVPLDQAEQDAAKYMLESFGGADFRESLAALMDKRRPKFERFQASARIPPRA